MYETRRPAWFCGCGAVDNKKECLADVLNAFSQEGGRGYVHADLDRFREVKAKYSPGAVELICYLLDHLDYMKHSGCVCCSQWLTSKGEELREWANQEETE